MEKLKRYNQIILAIGGTVVVLATLIFSILLGYETFRQWWPKDNTDTRIIAGDEIEELKADSVRKQVVSFNNITLIDTPGLKYLIPVGQANLERKEAAKELSGLINRYGDGAPGFDIAYNNLLLYDGKTGSVQKIFNKRLSINKFDVQFKKAASPVIFMNVTEDDSNRDGFYDARDLEKLCFYRLDNKSLYEVAAPGKTFLWMLIHKNPDAIVAQYGIDRDGDGEFEPSFEPKTFYRLNLESGQLVLIISPEIVQELQRQLDGN